MNNNIDVGEVIGDVLGFLIDSFAWAYKGACVALGVKFVWWIF